MITKEKFEKGLWFYHKNEPNIIYNLSVDDLGELVLIDADAGYEEIYVKNITEHGFDISKVILSQKLVSTIYFYNLILKYDNTTRL